MQAQTPISDSIPKLMELNEVIVISKSTVSTSKQLKCLASLDEYLNHSSKVTLIKRGSYGWEPMINNMTSERLNITIDGMHIFGACTDKMDPVTSYVDVSNLEEVKISSGQNGSYTGHTIGGALNMVRNKYDFSNPGWSGNTDFGFESNSGQVTTGANLTYINPKIYSNVDFMYRNAGNYKAGGGKMVEFSQFTKYNSSANIGIRLNSRSILSGSFIIDRATNIGYPALPMDVSLASANIANIQFTSLQVSSIIKEWDSKLYYNTVTHVMDDTRRPSVLMHMDMPGWTSTLGIYSKITAVKGKHKTLVHLNAYHSRARAEMTMYPKDNSAPPMFMYTWPDVQTSYFGISISDQIRVSKYHSLNFSISPGYQQNYVANIFGLNSLKIFYPEMSAKKSRLLYSAQVGYAFRKGKFEVSSGLGYGERAPSVSESYGFYLFNSFDKYDYIGNPQLNKEKSLEVNMSTAYIIPKLRIDISATYFHILDYIIGIYNPAYSPMTPGASGVRVYEALSYANILTTSLQASYRPVNFLNATAFIGYGYGRDNDHQHLPLIRPFSYRVSVTGKIKRFEMEISADGAAKQSAFSKKYGEDETPDYIVYNFYTGYRLNFNRHKINIRLGIENIADTYYSTYSDWNNIARKGRNFFFSVSYSVHKRKAE